MVKKRSEHIQKYFGAEPTVIIMGFLCGLYMLFALKAEKIPFLINIIPPFKGEYFIGLSVAVIVYQVMIWRRFRLFSDEWYRSFRSWLLFFTEFMTIFFSASILSWPIFFIYQFVLYLSKV